MAGANMMKLTTLQAGRGIAALAVVFYHAHSHNLASKIHPGESVFRPFDIGYFGVEYFFVLSGFIMMLVHAKDIGKHQAILPFMWKRFYRIFPLYWLVLTGLVVVFMFLPELGNAAERTPENIIRSYFLLRYDVEFIIVPAWTLSHEVLFYLLFGMLLVNRMLGSLALAMWFLVTVINALMGGWDSRLVFSPYNILFFFGIAAYYSLNLIPTKRCASFCLLGGAVFLGQGLLIEYELFRPDLLTRSYVYGLGAMLMISGAVKCERSRGWKAGRVLGFLGDASFAIYIIHGPVQAALGSLLIATKVSESLPPLWTLVVLVSISTLAGIMGHLLLEKPLMRAGKKFENLLFTRGGTPLESSARSG